MLHIPIETVKNDVCNRHDPFPLSNSPRALGWAGCANLTPPGHQCKSRSAITGSLLPIARLLGDCTIGLGIPLPEEPLSLPTPKAPVPLYGKWSGMASMPHWPTPGTDPAVIWLGGGGKQLHLYSHFAEACALCQVCSLGISGQNLQMLFQG